MTATRNSFLRTCLTVLILAAGSCLAGCQGVTSIKSVLDDPSQYTTESVRIAGRVTSSAGLLGVGAYKIDDGTGSIAVVSGSSGAPREGAEVVVEGKVKAAFTLGTESATVLIEERRKTR
ncbi:MAG: OB-fold nucleic acid binding domain-containing protein [Candidatus Eisenbacteria bacterium]|nr:OB-fold nucleic acid binding domain-containing protein [Candidatus Eisenbacteria bacterium]